MLATQRPPSMMSTYQQNNASLQSFPQVRPRPQSQLQTMQSRQSRRGSIYRPFSRISIAQNIPNPRGDPDSHRLLADNIPDLDQYINECLSATEAFFQANNAKRSSSVPRPPRIDTPSRQNSPSPSVKKQPQPRYYAQLNNLESSSSSASQGSSPSTSQGSSPSVEALSPVTYSSNNSSIATSHSRAGSNASFSNGGDCADGPLPPPPTIGLMSEQGSRSDPSLRPRAMSRASTASGSNASTSRRHSLFSSGHGEFGNAIKRRGTLMKQKWNASQPAMRQSAAVQGSSPLRLSAMHSDDVPPSEASRPATSQKKRRGFFKLFKRDSK
ncbi:hypothetical protein KEM56_001982 [Ascosphaera pollenicola]|nr:hypothetical protein KEM56_001982 [Ascosphaera pollenicola]